MYCISNIACQESIDLLYSVSQERHWVCDYISGDDYWHSYVGQVTCGHVWV